MIVMPEGVANLPRDDRGFPITFVTYRNPTTGKPDFRVLDSEMRGVAIRDRLCAICGTALGYWIFFVGGPLSVKNRTFNDPAMHEDCARYAVATCPFLANDTAHYAKQPATERHPDVPEEEFSTDPHVLATRPERMVLYRTRSYRQIVTRDSKRGLFILIKAAPPAGLEDVVT